MSMQLSSADADCRYLAAPGTRTSGVASRFGGFLKRLGADPEPRCTLRQLVEAGWVRPVLRVPLPRAVFDTWPDYPLLGGAASNDCPEGDRWALALYLDTVSSSSSADGADGEDWWLHPLDADGWLGQAARDHAVDPGNPSLLPPVFRHARDHQEVAPWLDYFAYWQAFQVIEVLEAITARFAFPTDELPTEVQLRWSVTGAHRVAGQVRARWKTRVKGFGHLSTVRTVFGAAASHSDPPDLGDTLRRAGARFGFDVAALRHDLRDTLLVLWRDWGRGSVPLLRLYPAAAELLRQEVEYAVEAIRLLGGSVDFYDPFWFDGRQQHEWADLIEALPLEREQARAAFADVAPEYLKKLKSVLPTGVPADTDALADLLACHWAANPPLRRLVLAFHRLHRELGPQRLAAEEGSVHAAERIEQLLLTALHGERVLSLVQRRRKGGSRYPDATKLFNETLQHVLIHLCLTKRGVCEKALKEAKRLKKERDQLHDIDATGLRLVAPPDVASGDAAADAIVAAFVNLSLFRNYAAHHDALDAELIYPSADDAEQHPGKVALTSVLLAVVLCLHADGPLAAPVAE